MLTRQSRVEHANSIVLNWSPGCSLRLVYLRVKSIVVCEFVFFLVIITCVTLNLISEISEVIMLVYFIQFEFIRASKCSFDHSIHASWLFGQV